MTNKQRYQRAFSALHASEECLMEVKAMKHSRFKISRMAAICAAALLVVGMATVAYAADVGNIQRTIQLWIHGDQTNAVLDIQDGSYTMTYQGPEGGTHEIFGGGVAFEADGSERPLTEEEILEQLNMPEVEYREDGTVWVWYWGKSVEITDKFENGVCYVMLQGPDGPLYMTVKYDNGYATSPNSYISPTKFN